MNLMAILANPEPFVASSFIENSVTILTKSIIEKRITDVRRAPLCISRSTGQYNSAYPCINNIIGKCSTCECVCECSCTVCKTNPCPVNKSSYLLSYLI